MRPVFAQVALLCAAAALSACGGGATLLGPGRAPETPTPAPNSTESIVVSTQPLPGGSGSSAVLTFNAAESGNVAPLVSLGAASGIQSPLGIGLDSAGNLYALNSGGNGGFQILEFASGWNAASLPQRTISGSATTLSKPEAFAVDPLGDTFVADAALQAILMFSPGAQGDIAPARTIAGSQTGLGASIESLTTSSLDDVYAASGLYVLGFDPSQNGNVQPTRTIGGRATGLDQPVSLSFLSNGNLYVGTTKGVGSLYPQIETFTGLETGDMAPLSEVGGLTSQITAPVAIAFDAEGYLYVANSPGCSNVFTLSGPPGILVFPPGDVGDKPPVSVISGSNTHLGCITGISVY